VVTLRYYYGRKMAGLKEIAEDTGMSINTVSRALRGVGYVSGAAREKILVAAKELNYRPNRAARSLRTSKNYRIPVLAFIDAGSWVCDYLHMGKVVGINRVMTEAGYDISLQFMRKSSKLIGNSLKQFRDILAEHPSGIILIDGGEFALQVYKACGKVGVPVAAVTYDRKKNVDCVYLDRRNGVCDAVLHMADRGKSRIAYAGPVGDHSRLDGYRKALSGLGTPEIIYEIDAYRKASLRKIHQLGVEAALEMAEMNPRPDGVQAYSDYLAAGMLEGFRKAGLSVPGDVAVCGFDDRELAQAVDPGLTTVAQPTRETGEAVATMLLEKMKQGNAYHGKAISVPMNLTVREST
jgi:DNA-binding LacI/PurR family transcriptional regulator